MALWDTLTGWIDKDRQHYLLAAIPPERAGRKLHPHPLEANRHYVRLRLAEMFLRKQTSWFKSWYPAVHSLVKFSFGNEMVEAPNIADASRLGIVQSGQGDIVARNFLLTPTIPFNGGTISINAGLVALEGENYLGNFLKVLGNFAALLNVSQLSTVLNIAQPLATGIQELFGAGNGRVHLGFHNSYAAGELKDCYFAVIRATESELASEDLLVDNDQLRIRTGDGKSAPVTGFDYLLFRLELFENRDDWENLKSIQEPFQEAIRALHHPDTEAQATFHLRTAMLRARQSAELTGADRRRVVELLRQQFENTKQELGVLGAVSKSLPTLKKAMKYAISVQDALSQGEPTEAEILSATTLADRIALPATRPLNDDDEALDQIISRMQNLAPQEVDKILNSFTHKAAAAPFEGSEEDLEASSSPENSAKDAKLHFRLDGDGAFGDQVKCSTDVDLIFDYDKVRQGALAAVSGEKLNSIVTQGGELMLHLITNGFVIRDSKWMKKAVFQNGKLTAPVVFKLKAADEVVEDAGLHLTFSKDGANLYELFLPVTLVAELRPDTQRVFATPDLDLDEMLSIQIEPRSARLTLKSVGEKIQYSYHTSDSLETPLIGEFQKVTRSSLANKLGQIRDELQEVTEHQLWPGLGYRIDNLQSDGEKRVMLQLLEKVVSAGASLYQALAEDKYFKELLEAINKLKPGSRICIHTDCAFLPWEILYPHRYNFDWPDDVKAKHPLQVPDLWGYRFAFECLHLTYSNFKPPYSAHRNGKTFISYNLNPTIDKGFSSSSYKPMADQVTWANELAKDSHTVEVKQDGKSIKGTLLTPDHEATLIYLYCHGRNEHPFQADSGEALELDKDVLIEPDLLTDGSTYSNGPIVFLNSCSSGAFSPLAFTSFLTRFREKKALGLIATSFPVPASFAAKYGDQIIKRYVSKPSTTIGDVLLQERRHLLDNNNPLGLFYSLQCPMDITARNS